MTWVPHYAKEKPPCQCCGTQSYIEQVPGDCSWTQGFIFCSDTCKFTYRWRHKFKIYEYHDPHPTGNPKGGKNA